jgi:hypothetical protein
LNKKIRILNIIALIAIFCVSILALSACNKKASPLVASLTLISGQKSEYVIGDTLFPIKILVEYDNDTAEEKTFSSNSVSGFSTVSEGSFTATVTYGGKTVSYPYTVKGTAVTVSAYAVGNTFVLRLAHSDKVADGVHGLSFQLNYDKTTLGDVTCKYYFRENVLSPSSKNFVVLFTPALAKSDVEILSIAVTPNAVFSITNIKYSDGSSDVSLPDYYL